MMLAPTGSGGEPRERADVPTVRRRWGCGGEAVVKCMSEGDSERQGEGV